MKRILLFFMIAIMSCSLYAISDTTIVRVSSIGTGYRLQFNTYDSWCDTLIGGETAEFFKVNFPCEDLFSYQDSIGMPELPYVSLNLQIPANSYPIFHMVTVEYVELDINLPYLPHQTIRGDGHYEGFMFNENFYETTQHFDTTNFITVSDAYNLLGTTGFEFRFNPVVYNPQSGRFCVARSIDAYVDFSDGSIADLYNEAGSYDTQSFYDYQLDLPTPNFATKRLLIITSDAYVNYLTDYVDYRESQGVDVTIRTVEYIASEYNSSSINAEILRDFIRTRYYAENEYSRPNYLLLVGDPSIIPYSAGVYSDEFNPETDLFYACLEHSSISHESPTPELFVGRWPIDTIDYAGQIKAMTDHVIMYEDKVARLSRTQLKPLLLTGTDSEFSNSMQDRRAYSYMRNNAKVLEKKGIGYTFYDGRQFSFNVSRTILKEELESGVYFLNYFGHGSPDSIGHNWSVDIADPHYIYKMPPIALFFACAVNALEAPDYHKFSHKILTNLGNSFVCSYAATTIAYDDMNAYLNKDIIKGLSRNRDLTLGELIYWGEAKFCSSRYFPRRFRQVKRYNLYGDPLLFVNGDRRAASQQSIQSNIYIEQRNNTITIENVDSEIVLYVYDCLGRFISSQMVIQGDIVELNYTSGLYVLVGVKDNVVVYRNKIFINK